MEDQFDPSKEGRRIVSHYGQPNERQVTEDKQRDQEREARGKDDQSQNKER